jgi:hypothetical protein
MATTTPNFGWPVPTSTDLVKDGATAMEALGDAIDTSMVDLKGGTTGQVLAKTSNTDMDFSWVAQDDSNAIQNTIVDAKGDLIAASAADTPARLAVGSNGETLVADSSTSTGLRYQAPKVQNGLYNSSMQVWQRGTSFTSTLSYTADRYYKGTASANTVTRQATNDTTNLPNIQYCLRSQRNSGSTSTTALEIWQGLETLDSIKYAGKTVTFSFYARAGANFSATGMGFNIFSGTGTDQNLLSTGYTNQVNVAGSNTGTLPTTWTRYSVTGTVGTTATELSVYFNYTPTGTAGANDYFEITGLQLEVGSVATPYTSMTGTIQGELAACQRYYFRNNSGSTNFSWFAWGIGQGSSQALFSIPCPVTMRTTPTVVEFANLGLAQTGGISAITTLVHANSSPSAAFLQSNGTNTADAFYRLMANNSSSAYVGIGAEL